MVRVVVNIPDELVDDIEDIMNAYELTIDELVETAIRRLMKKHTHTHSEISSAVLATNITSV